MKPEDDAERDAWLSQALRHAPDASVGPPPALSDAILREARSATGADAASAATAPSAKPSADTVGPRAVPGAVGGLLEAAWAWLARPSVAAGFASLLAATLVGMLWWDRPMDDAMPRAPEPVARSPAVQGEPQAVAPTAPGPTAPSATAPGTKDSNDAAAPVARPSSRDAAPPAQEQVRAAKKEAPARVATAESKSKAEAAAQDRVPGTSGERRDASKPDPFPAAAGPSAGDRFGAANAPEAPRARPDAKSRADAETAAREPGSTDRVAPAAPAAPTGRVREMAKVASSPLAALRHAVATEPQRWTWAVDGQTPRPIAPALQRWLEHVDAALTEQRAVGPLAQAPSGAAPAPARSEDAAAETSVQMRLLRDGREHTILRIGSDAVQLEGAETGRGRAGLKPAEATALRAELAAAAR